MAIPLSSEVLYPFLIKQLGILITGQFHQAYTTYSAPNIAPPQDDECEVERLQMDRLLKWMKLVFDESFTPTDPLEPTPSTDTLRAYKQELFSIYRTLCSEYQQYRNWKQYNQSLWLFSSYRVRDTKTLARKLLSDVRLFKEGVQLFFMMEQTKRVGIVEV